MSTRPGAKADGTLHDVDQAANSPFGAFLGLKILAMSPEEAAAELPVGPELINKNGVLHGGAVMALADSLAGAASFDSVKGTGLRTTTVESKTNFLQPVPLGDTAEAVCQALHRGRTLMIWQTTIRRKSDGKRAAVVIQTQLILANPSDGKRG